MALPDPIVPITTVKIKDAVVYNKDNVEDVYVMTTVDASKSIFIGMNVSTKTPYTFVSADQVHIIVVPEAPNPKLGDELLALP